MSSRQHCTKGHSACTVAHDDGGTRASFTTIVSTMIAACSSAETLEAPGIILASRFTVVQPSATENTCGTHAAETHDE
eukprot:11216197-Lingulodinium_polyedra.AAC.1